MKKHVLLIGLVAFLSKVSAASLGVVGDTFPIAEMSFLTFIELRLNELQARGELDKINDGFVQKASLHANRPTPVGLPRTQITTEHFYTPEVWAHEAILDELGRVVVAGGTHINALEKIPGYAPVWLFFNGDDDAQVKWAARQLVKYPDAKIILTGGAVGDAEKVLSQAVFFDQMGRISEQLGINQVPALVSRVNNQLAVLEIAIKEDGDAR